MVKSDKSNIKKYFEDIEGYVWFLETMIDVIKRDVEDADVEQPPLNAREVKFMQGNLERILKLVKRILRQVEKDNPLEEINMKILIKATLYQECAIRILSKVEGLGVVKGKAALQTFKSIIDDFKGLKEASLMNIDI